MSGQDLEGRNPVVLAVSAFVVGLLGGVLLKDAGKRVYERARSRWWHHEVERTSTYDNNLPESLGRREPSPYPGQPRYGGTGALGVSPAAVPSARPEEQKD
jgi:hypothetical protein